jgi:tRNA modification GTPase
LQVDDTIAAIATAAGGGLRGIVRISGPQSADVVTRIGQFAEPVASMRRPRCNDGSLDLPHGLGSVPVRLYLWPTNKSYTRQPSAELHLPGSPPVLAAALDAVCAAGARLALPGEFTLRAFLAGRLDLTQAEAVLGVIDADTRRQLDAALAQLAGGLARPLAALRERLIDLLAHLEAGLDFVDEDIEFISRQELSAELNSIGAAIASIAAQVNARGQSSQLPRVAIIGLPNVGKSSLLNALAGDDAAIVSDLAGTTRDCVTRGTRLNGQDCLLIDTAGIATDSSQSEIEHAAQAAATQAQAQADLTLLCIDGSRPLTTWEEDLLQQNHPNRILVKTKCDLPRFDERPTTRDAIRISSRTGEGIAELKTAIARSLQSAGGEAGVVAGTAERCRDSLRLAGESLGRSQAVAAGGQSDELIAAEIRVALDELGRVVGAVYTEDILDRIFGRFCIGK